jgi:hypothetical protein
MWQERRPDKVGHADAIKVLTSAIGIDHESYERLVEWALAEHLVTELAVRKEFTSSFFRQPDALKRFAQLLASGTRRAWSRHDIAALFRRVQIARTKHYREAIAPEDLLALVWQVVHECKRCRRRPPEVVLHIDHIIPVKAGGSSKRGNLQFLCAEHNLKKGAKREVSDRWLDFA